MFKTTLIFLCWMAIIVSGAEDVTLEPVVTNPLKNLPNETTVITKQSPDVTASKVPVSSPSTMSDIPTELSTTIASDTTTTSSSTTKAPAPTPTPVPSPDTGKWIVNVTTETCIIAQMALQFNITYPTKDQKQAYKVLNLPANKTWAQGNCGATSDNEQNITLSWNSTNLSKVPNNLTLHFVKNATKSQYTLHHLEVYFVPEEFPQILTNYSTFFLHRSDQFTTGLYLSYRCLKVQALNLTRDDNTKAGEIKISNLQFQAFRVEKTTSFGFAEDCAFDTPDIVPIAVGCALAALVVIVLVAYLVGRKRSQARGYLSM